MSFELLRLVKGSATFITNVGLFLLVHCRNMSYEVLICSESFVTIIVKCTMKLPLTSMSGFTIFFSVVGNEILPTVRAQMSLTSKEIVFMSQMGNQITRGSGYPR